jgi:hypothetical protein
VSAGTQSRLAAVQSVHHAVSAGNTQASISRFTVPRGSGYCRWGGRAIPFATLHKPGSSPLWGVRFYADDEIAFIRTLAKKGRISAAEKQFLAAKAKFLSAVKA